MMYPPLGYSILDKYIYSSDDMLFEIKTHIHRKFYFMKMSLTFSYLVLALQLSLLAGCQSAPATKNNQFHSSVPVAGATLVTHTDILIPLEQAHIYIQNGQILTVNDTNLYTPHCKLRLKNIQPDSQRISPDRFQIIEVRRYTELFLLTETNRLQVAGQLVIGGGGGDLGDIMYITELKLHSDQQPQVTKLLCQQLDDPALGEYVSAVQIINTLGKIASLDSKDQS
jgi:hypothetical protein